MLLKAYESARLLDNYDVYDCLLNYWNAKLQDDVYAIKASGYEVGREKNYHGKIKNDKYNNMGTEVLMAICVGLRMNLRIVEKIFDKSDNKLNYYQDPDKTYIRILENMPGLSLQDFNGVLKQAGIKELGSTIKDDPD